MTKALAERALGTELDAHLAEVEDSELAARYPAIAPSWLRAWIEAIPFLDCPSELRRLDDSIKRWTAKRKATTATVALEHALIARFGTLGRVENEFPPRSDNGLVCTRRHFTALVRSHGRKAEFITPHCPQQNGMVGRLIRSRKRLLIVPAHRRRA